jgi:hypothetical protein
MARLHLSEMQNLENQILLPRVSDWVPTGKKTHLGFLSRFESLNH